jgi:hypothetical protein
MLTVALCDTTMPGAPDLTRRLVRHTEGDMRATVPPASGSPPRPVREVRGFERATLQPGERTTVAFRLGPDELRRLSTRAEPFDVPVSAESTATLTAAFTVVR